MNAILVVVFILSLIVLIYGIKVLLHICLSDQSHDIKIKTKVFSIEVKKHN